MMARLFLTLLALLTGLSAQLAPAQARVCESGASAVGVMDVACTAQSAVRADVSGLAENSDCASRSLIAAAPARRPQVAASVPVRIGIDRARE